MIPIKWAGTEPFLWTRIVIIVGIIVGVSGIYECGRHLNRIATALERTK